MTAIHWHKEPLRRGYHLRRSAAILNQRDFGSSTFCDMLYAPAARAAYRPFRGRKTNGFSGALTEELTSLDSVGLVSPVVILGPGGVLAPNVLGYPDSYSGPLVQLQILPSATPGFHGANTFNLTYGSLNGRSVSSNSVAFSVDVASSA